MQTDLFLKENDARIKHLKQRKQQITDELAQVNQQLHEIARKSTSVEIGHSDGYSQTFLCQLPSGRSFIYKTTAHRQTGEPQFSEYHEVDLDLLSRAVHSMIMVRDGQRTTPSSN